MLIYMDDYRKAQESKVDPLRRYDEELLCVNWNPSVHGMAKSSQQTAAELSPQLPEDFSTIDAQAFLDRVYALATQV